MSDPEIRYSGRAYILNEKMLKVPAKIGEYLLDFCDLTHKTTLKNNVEVWIEADDIDEAQKMISKRNCPVHSYGVSTDLLFEVFENLITFEEKYSLAVLSLEEEENE